jgi:uncharacterized protein YdaT
MTRLTLRIQALLHPSDEKERDAIEIWNGWLSEGYSPRQILTTIILAFKGRTPDMYREKSAFSGELRMLEERLTGRIEDLHTAIENDIGTILKDIKSADPKGSREYAAKDADDSDGSDFDPEFIANARKTVRKTYKQRLQDGDE